MATFLDDKYYPTNASTAMFTNVEPYRSDQLAPPQRNVTIFLKRFLGISRARK